MHIYNIILELLVDRGVSDIAGGGKARGIEMHTYSPLQRGGGRRGWGSFPSIHTYPAYHLPHLLSSAGFFRIFSLSFPRAAIYPLREGGYGVTYWLSDSPGPERIFLLIDE